MGMLAPGKLPTGRGAAPAAPSLRDLLEPVFDLIDPGLDEQRMVVPAGTVVDGGRADETRARVRDVLLIALPARLRAVRRKNKAQRARHPFGRHFAEAFGDGGSRMAEADIDGHVAAAL